MSWTDDQLAITALLSRYARAVDTKDWELYRTVFTTDARIDYTSAGAIAGTVDEVTGWLARGFAAIPWSMHYITNVDAETIGDTANVRAMFYNPMQLPGVEGMSVCGGYYYHRMVRSENGWRSADLREDNVWFTNRPG